MKNRSRRLIVVMTLILGCVLQRSALAAGSGVARVVVDCSKDCTDQVGSRLCYALKEKIRASAGYKLVDDSPALAAGVRMVCDDPDDGSAEEGGHRTVAAVTLTLTSTTDERYLTTSILTVGGDRTERAAEAILAFLDSHTEPFRQSLLVR